jgi:hypothetical protein
MKKTFIFAVLTVLTGALFAQTPAVKTATGSKKAPAAKPVSAAAGQPEPAPRPAPAEKPAAKQAEEPEESMVMIDDRSETAATGAARASDSEEPAAVPGGIPSSYGQCKGVVNDGGRSLLVFESADDGALSFVQVVFGKTGVSWKLVAALPRSSD